MRRLRLSAWIPGILSLALSMLISSTAMAGGFKGDVKRKENSVSIRRQEAEREAFLIPGCDVRSALVELAGSEQFIRSIRFAETGPDFNRIVHYKNLSESGAPVYAWCPEDETTAILLYSGAEVIYLNPDSSNMFSRMSSLADISGLKKLDSSRTENFSGMFAGCGSVPEWGSIGEWDVSKGTDFGRMFNSATVDSLEALRNWDVSAGENFEMTFAHCGNLTTLSGLETWNMAQAKNMADMFISCKKLENLDALADWDVSQAENMAELFAGCEGLTFVDGLADWDVSSCRHFVGTSSIKRGMFYNCQKLANVDGLRNWNVSKVISFRSMFFRCESLKSIWGLQNWDVSGSGDFYQMFHLCYSLRNLEPLGGWNLGGAISMRDMFRDCRNLVSLAGLEEWDVSGVENFSCMFSGCTKLREIGALADWDVSSGKDLGSMFYECQNITDISGLKDWNPASCCENIAYLFCGTQVADASMLSRHTAVRAGVPYTAWDIDTSVTAVEGAFKETSITNAVGFPDWYPSYKAGRSMEEAGMGMPFVAGETEDVWVEKATESDAKRATESNAERVTESDTKRAADLNAEQATDSNAKKVTEPDGESVGLSQSTRGHDG